MVSLTCLYMEKSISMKSSTQSNGSDDKASPVLDESDSAEVDISVVLDEPKEGYYGGLVAAPVFKEIAERAAGYLNIRPDITEPAPQIAAQKDNSPARAAVPR